MKPEQIIQCQIVDWMSTKTQEHNFMYFSVPNEATIKTAFATNRDRMVEDIHGRKSLPEWLKRMVNALVNLLKNMGMISGTSDLVLGKDGKMYCMEVKTETGKQQRNQIFFEKRCHECGIEYAIVRSLEEAKWTMQEWGIVG